MTKDETIAELVELVMLLTEQNEKLKTKIRRIEEYIEVYEDYIKGADSDGNGYTSRNIREK